MREQSERGISLSNKNYGETVESIFTRHLNNQLQKGKLEKSTNTTQINRAKKHVFPYIGEIDFSGLNKDAIEIWLSQLIKSNLAIGTIHGIYSDVAKIY